MKCSKCGEFCVGAETGVLEEDVCMECAYPALKDASEAAARRVEENHFERTGEQASCGEIFRGILDRASNGYK